MTALEEKMDAYQEQFSRKLRATASMGGKIADLIQDNAGVDFYFDAGFLQALRDVNTLLNKLNTRIYGIKP